MSGWGWLWLLGRGGVGARRGDEGSRRWERGSTPFLTSPLRRLSPQFRGGALARVSSAVPPTAVLSGWCFMARAQKHQPCRATVGGTAVGGQLTVGPVMLGWAWSVVRLRIRVLTHAALMGALVVGGCARERVDDGFVGAVEERPSYAELREQVNARSERLGRLWARATVVVDSVVDGEARRDQADGYLQVVRPTKLSLSLGKSIDRMYFFLGSDEERYWWVDTLDAEQRVALVGTHARATAARAAEFGVPVHPLDLIELLGISGLPEEGETPRWDAEVGGWAVTVAARFGERRVVYDHVERLPRLIELFGEDGELAARARLGDYKRLTEFDGVGLRPEVAKTITIELPRLEATVLFDLGATKSIERLPREIVFDLEALLRRERVSDVRDLDEPGP